MLPENVAAVEFFLAVQTQWRVGFGGPVGLDYAGVEAAARLLGIALNRELFEKLQILEMNYVQALTQKIGATVEAAKAKAAAQPRAPRSPRTIGRGR